MSLRRTAGAKRTRAAAMWQSRAAWLVIALAAQWFYLFENNTGTRALLFTVLLLPAVSALLLYLPRARPAAELALPETARRGEAAEGMLRLKNGGKIHVLRISCELAIQNLLTGERAVVSVETAVRAGKTAAVPFTFTAAHTGKLAVSLENVRAMDFLGLFSRRLSAAAEGTVTVPPVLRPVALELAESADALADAQTYSSRKPGYDPSETFRIREYVPGDPIRQIHWKLSRKTDTLLVRDLGLPVVHRMLLLMETSVLPGTAILPSETDVLLDLLFSVSAALLAMEIPHTAGWHDQRRDRFASREVASEEDQAVLREVLLGNPITEGETTVAGSFGRESAERAFAHVALFSTYIPPDAGALLHGNRVTALLAGTGAGAAAPDSGLETIAVPPEFPHAETMRIVL